VFITGLFKYCIHGSHTSYAQITKFQQPAGQYHNRSWNDHKDGIVDTTPDTILTGAQWFQQTPCESTPGADAWQMVPLLKLDGDPNLTGSPFIWKTSTFSAGDCDPRTVSVNSSGRACAGGENHLYWTEPIDNDSGAPLTDGEAYLPLTTIRVELKVCFDGPSIPEVGGNGYVGWDAIPENTDPNSVEWETQQYFHFPKSSTPQSLGEFYQTLPPDVGETIGFYPRYFTALGSNPDANALLTGADFEITTCDVEETNPNAPLYCEDQTLTEGPTGG
jgi:hypothetical protein